MQNGAQKQKKIPMRQCLGCNTHKPKKELIRVVRLPEGGVVLDFVGKRSGRGAYICPDKACFAKARKSGKISRALECEIGESIYDEMEAAIADAEKAE